MIDRLTIKNTLSLLIKLGFIQTTVDIVILSEMLYLYLNREQSSLDGLVNEHEDEHFDIGTELRELGIS